MDTSEIYIKMCDKSGLEECCSYGIPAFREKVKYIGNNVFVELDQCSTTWRTVRLLRQSQIQEMMDGDKGTFCDWLLRLEEFTHIAQPWDISVNKSGLKTISWLETWEQLWLAFYMSEKHQKFWGKKGWKKVNNIE